MSVASISSSCAVMGCYEPVTYTFIINRDKIVILNYSFPCRTY